MLLEPAMPGTSGWEVLASMEADPRLHAFQSCARSPDASARRVKWSGRVEPGMPRNVTPPDHGAGPQRAHSSGTYRRPLALLIDDDTELLEMFAWCMRAGGWVVEHAANGREGLLAASLIQPDVILMDLNLPLIDGVEAIRRLKSDEDTRHIPVIACTGLDAASAQRYARAAGCDAFIAKPCEPEAIRALLEVFVRKGSVG